MFAAAYIETKRAHEARMRKIVATTLSELKAEGAVERVRRGHYRLPTTGAEGGPRQPNLRLDLMSASDPTEKPGP